MRPFVLAALLLGVVGPSTPANEEDILPARKLSVTVDGRKAFGEVTATLESSYDGKEGRLTAVTLVVGGKAHTVPREQFRELKDPLLETTRVLSGVEKGGSPILYLEFRLHRPGRKSPAEYPRVRVPLKDGKLLPLTIDDPAAAAPAQREARTSPITPQTLPAPVIATPPFPASRP